MTVPDGQAANGTLSLARKLGEVMALLEHVPKRGRNPHFGYDYATEADVADAVRSELGKRAVALKLDMNSWERIAGKTAGGKDTALWIVNITIELHDGDSGEVWSSPWVGVGDDPGDKGIAKALTNALKYYLLKTFLISTGDDAEGDGRPDGDPVSAGAAAGSRGGQAGRPSEPRPPGGATAGGDARKISAAQNKRLVAIAMSHGLDIKVAAEKEIIERICAYKTGGLKLSELTREHYDAVVTAVEAYRANQERAEAKMKAWEAEQEAKAPAPPPPEPVTADSSGLPVDPDGDRVPDDDNAEVPF